ncbi:hypothetical protein RRG08_018419 [Elysia crispata]|uniref:Uncharacterized protein n=1 Tax=Elysia crispata TaxID=231223 RepID=A0AAE0XQD9_9GAST|nr:hypothetical protein RRG08_018419 [Elysia crispata]
MYCRKAKLRLPLKSMLEEYKCGKARLLSMVQDSEDPVVKTVQPTLKTGFTQKLIIVELTVPYENRMEEAHISKGQKYLNLTKELEVCWLQSCGDSSLDSLLSSYPMSFYLLLAYRLSDPFLRVFVDLSPSCFLFGSADVV